ncbi:family 2 glycosyltransferase [Fimicolochytrium jonesii]|uniref:family 2 glycosyltransferase n=1 Tax=Fimicolochytrium jonesii TaxID=1396493 RepID=UPI0022FDF1BC|nr:family 2 glycosyltransferase [Fimicolochytrium jonesii]KAI8816225.1 family 2 glycosyltransferase [Fimicolochytrium jonesii]
MNMSEVSDSTNRNSVRDSHVDSLHDPNRDSQATAHELLRGSDEFRRSSSHNPYRWTPLAGIASGSAVGSDHEESTLVDEDSDIGHDDSEISEIIVLDSHQHPVKVVKPLPSIPRNPSEGKIGSVGLDKAALKGQSEPAHTAGGAGAPKRPPVDRTTWIDGLRGIASIIIFIHHFSDNTWEVPHPDVLQWGTPTSILKDGQFAVSLFFLLSGRVLTYGFLKGRNTGKVRWRSLASAIFRRTIRLALPIFVLAFMQQQVCLAGYADEAPRAAKFLETDRLGRPLWCNVTDFKGFLSYFIQVLSNPDHIYIRTLGSTLWSMYDQFWGSVYVYILSAFMVLMNGRRYIVYAFLSLWFWFANSPNMLFVLGLMLADLAASNITKRIRDKSWYIVLGLQLVFLVVAMFLIVDQEKADDASFGILDHTINPATGVLGGYNGGARAANPWPEVMRFKHWLSAVCIIAWVELAPGAQWFFSSRIFVFLGNITFGTYVIQMTVIYTIMPRLVLSFAAKGWSYWNNVILTFIICLFITLFLAWIFYRTVDNWSLKLARWMWNELFENGTTRISELPRKIGVGSVRLVKSIPGGLAAWGRNKSASTAAGYRKFNWFIRHWRSPVVRDRTKLTDADRAVPRDHLCSTTWTADLSNDKEAMRTAWLLRLNSFLAPVHFVGIPGLAFLWFWFNPIGPWSYDILTFGSLWRCLWCLSVPYCIITFIGFSTPRIARTKKDMDRRPVTREHIRNFYILIVTQGSNESAVRRGYNRMKPLEALHPSVRVFVLTDEPYSYPDLNNIVCPLKYKSPKGMSKHKARALDYFRHSQNLTTYDWILHMDEESTIDGESLRRCFDFIRYTQHDYGQGVILYDAYKYWHNWFFSVADGIRVGDDLARFNLQFTVINRPVFGVHGSFLMTNGDVENENTWDFGTLAEDFEFSQAAWQKGFTCGAIHGIVREQSPGSLRDFMKQRRRWYMGIREIEGMYYLPQMAIKLWTIGIFCLVATLINIPFSFFVDAAPTPLWIVIMSNFCFAVFYWLYLWGLLFQELDAGTKWFMVPVHFIAGIIIQPFASIAEGFAVMWAMSSENTGKFEVIKK